MKLYTFSTIDKRRARKQTIHLFTLLLSMVLKVYNFISRTPRGNWQQIDALVVMVQADSFPTNCMPINRKFYLTRSWNGNYDRWAKKCQYLRTYKDIRTQYMRTHKEQHVLIEMFKKCQYIRTHKDIRIQIYYVHNIYVHIRISVF